MSNVFGLYTTDDGALTFAIPIDAEHFTLMGFSAAPINTPRAPHKLRTRKERFFNSAGVSRDLSYPTTSLPVPFGTVVTIAGDPTFTAVRTLAEEGTGQST